MTTKAEREWMDAITRLGCIACILTNRGETPAEPHHLLSGGRRMGHLFTIPLCVGHHRIKEPGKQARHIHKSTFVAAYGTEMYLLEKTKALLGRRVAA